MMGPVVGETTGKALPYRIRHGGAPGDHDTCDGCGHHVCSCKRRQFTGVDLAASGGDQTAIVAVNASGMIVGQVKGTPADPAKAAFADSFKRIASKCAADQRLMVPASGWPSFGEPHASVKPPLGPVPICSACHLRLDDFSDDLCDHRDTTLRFGVPYDSDDEIAQRGLARSADGKGYWPIGSREWAIEKLREGFLMFDHERSGWLLIRSLPTSKLSIEGVNLIQDEACLPIFQDDWLSCGQLLPPA